MDAAEQGQLARAGSVASAGSVVSTDQGSNPAYRGKNKAQAQALTQLEAQAEVLGPDAAKQYIESSYHAEGRMQVQVEQRILQQTGVFHPYSQMYRIWWWVTIIAALVTGWLIPYAIGFLSPSLDTYDSDLGNTVVQAILIAIFCADILVSFNTAYYEGGRLVGDRRAIAVHYASARLWLDLATTLPWDHIIIAAMGGGDTQDTRYVSLVGLLKLGRMYRVRRLFRYLEFRAAISHIGTVMLRNSLLVFYVVHLFGCLFYFIARQEGFSPSQSWAGAELGSVLPSGGEEFASMNTFDRYLYSLYWAIVTFSTVGYGDLQPITTAEVVFVSVYIAVNLFVAAYFVANIILLVFKSDERPARLRDRMRALELYARANNLPQELRSAVVGHLRLAYSREQLNDETLLAALPTTLRHRILRALYGEVLTRSWLLANVKPKFVDALLACATVDTYMPQIDVLSEGDTVNMLSIVLAGYVEQFASVSAAEEQDNASLHDAARYLRTPEQVVADMVAGREGGGAAAGTGYALLGPGDCFGETAFFTEAAQLEHCRTLTACRVLVVPRSAYAALAADFPQSAQAVLLAVQRHAEANVQAEFRGGTATRLLRGSIVAQIPGLTYQNASAENTRGADGGAGAAPNSSSLTQRQEQVVGALMRIKAMVQHAVAQAGEARVGEFLSAASKGERERIKLMLQQGIQPDVADYDNRTALMLACASGHKAIAEMLLAVNARVNARDNLGGCALLEAARHGHEDITALLLRRGATLNLGKEAEAKELAGAVFAGDVAYLRRLLACRADANAVGDHTRRTALHVAAADGNLPAVRVLVEEGRADVGALNRSGGTPLDEAHTSQVFTVIEYLEGVVGAEVRDAARERYTQARADAFVRACSGGDAAAVAALLARGCPPDAADYDNRTGLMLASAKGHLEVVQQLLAAGANPSLRDNLGGCALLDAARHGRDAIIDALVAAGGAVSLPRGELASLLCSAVEARDGALLQRLVRAKVDVDAADYDARTPLHIAAAEGNAAAVEVLVREGGARTAVRDRWGNTPLAEAQRAGATDVVRFLKGYPS